MKLIRDERVNKTDEKTQFLISSSYHIRVIREEELNKVGRVNKKGRVMKINTRIMQLTPYTNLMCYNIRRSFQ
jgi:hypothetical protein